MLKVVHYINQFFANVGGEEMAHIPAEVREGIVGPGLALQQAFKDEAEIVATIVCGDSYFNENMDEAKKTIIEMVKKYEPDLFIVSVFTLFAYQDFFLAFQFDFHYFIIDLFGSEMFSLVSHPVN
jgi:glycine/betaine/sarcosine/D-proline reductase family selenoprotein B